MRYQKKFGKMYLIKTIRKFEDNFWEYISYWNEKYYRNGFADVIELLEI